MSSNDEVMAEYYRQLQIDYEETISYEDSYGNIILISEKDQQMMNIVQYLIDRPHSMSLRKLEKEFGVPKTTISNWIHHELPYIDDDKYCQCKHILNSHKPH